MKPHEWTNRCIADDLELHPEKDPEATAREWRQLAWSGGWHQQGRVWSRQAKASRRRRERQAMAKLAATVVRLGESCAKVGDAMRFASDAFASFGRAWSNLDHVADLCTGRSP